MTSTPWTADSLVARFDQVRFHTERLAAPLSPEDQTVQSMPDVSPTKWHRAHVTWFFETFVLADHEAGFADAIVGHGWPDPGRTAMSRAEGIVADSQAPTAGGPDCAWHNFSFVVPGLAAGFR